MNSTKQIFQRAERFIWTNGRLLERRLFEFHFKDGPAEALIKALLGYQNSDGGFGNALEPDIRCPDSQPVPCQHALEILDEVAAATGAFHHQTATEICDFLLTITTAEGGVPWVLPVVAEYPHAPWWRAEANPSAAINPTGIICGVLHKHNFDHPWLEPATRFCWSVVESEIPEGMHDAGAILQFLEHVPDRERAEIQIKRHVQHLLDSGLAAKAGDEGYVWKPLDWAPNPSDLLRPHFAEAEVQAHLDEIFSEQQADGGWPINFPAFSPACELEWRGWQTIKRLKMLQSNGVLG